MGCSMQFATVGGLSEADESCLAIGRCVFLRYYALSRQGPREARPRGGTPGGSRGRNPGQGSVAEGEYLRNMKDARLCPDETARWVEVCYCPTPLLEERPYWEEYFDLGKVQDAMTAGGTGTRTAPSPGLVGMRLHPAFGVEAGDDGQAVSRLPPACEAIRSITCLRHFIAPSKRQ
jgi:hypothetical protein